MGKNDQPEILRTGLSAAEVAVRLEKYGPNSVPEKPPKSLFRRFIEQFQSPLIYILLIALFVDLLIWFFEGASGVPIESAAIALILLMNSGLGMYQEGKSEAALARLKAMAAPLAWVLRDGHFEHIPTAGIVPGDIVRMEAGDRVPADAEIRSPEGALVDESILTGESVPVEKLSSDELFSGTLLMRGKVFAEVTKTGPKSTMGRLAVMIGEIETGKTPLELRLSVFANQIAKVILALAILILVGGLLIEGTDRLGHVLIFAVALAVAAIPEGLPAVLTLTLALGVERMAKRKAVVRRLSAVEALGSVTVITTDKTGTLTENKMFVRGLDVEDEARAVRAMVLANDADESGEIGDPLELALLEYAEKAGIDLNELRSESERISTLPFDSSYKFMRVTVSEEGKQVSYLKGAPEVLLERSELGESEKGGWQRRIEEHATEGFRVLAVGARNGEGDDAIEFLGLIKLWDPPRPEVPDAIREAREAGIRVIMATGDHPETAKAIAGEIGIPVGGVLTGSDVGSMSDEELSAALENTTIFARVNPEHKLRLVETLRSNGEVVAMTGDGVNDAPALKRSDVGVAMGQRGSDVSREVADLVLMDDNFATIVAAIEEGRSIYDNIQKFIRFLFSTNLALVLLVVGGAFGSFWLGLTDEFGGLLLPLTAVQLLWINIIADGPPALALGLDRNPGVMRQMPRDPEEPLLDRPSIRFILSTGFFKALMGGVLLVFLPRLGYSLLATRTGVFLFESIVQLVMAYPSRKISVVPRSNILLHFAVILGTALQIATIYLTPLRTLLGLESLDIRAMALIFGAILITWAAAETYLAFDRTYWGNPRRRVNST
ncbi:MAG TPA: HAD-IC family P-type ATPase [Pyrinomonadaceae bacterium]|nr:HAD-IC family P-type ATPase [Pyrinomonadaceae bacterium]HMP64384.1 HAD-IC family P-type ATPase [Pyrinomonadaceae bacterium]